ncbi:MAG: efflux RND transporter periplasmic adaptor subunit [Ignavibacteriae bacterium]|nr:efflux RND transporter periplasmic adaptor subunit [Ignavibacteriota bacterium]
MKKIILLFSVILSGISFFSGCTTEKKEAKNMEQIYKEEGIPVRVKEAVKSNFTKELTYNSILSGIEESSASASMGGRIEKVLTKVGDFVKKDQVLFTFPADAPGTQYFQAQSAYENAKSTYERYKTLHEVGGVSAQNLDNIKTQFEVNRANWETVRKVVNVLAPITGYVTKVSVVESEDVRKETVLATVADLRKLKASIQVSEEEINDVRKGGKAYAEWQGLKIPGIISQVDMAMDPMTQSFNADIIFENPNAQIKAGITADITIVNEKKGAESITLERKDLIKKGNDFYVYVFQDGKSVMKKVEVGKSSGINVEILSGINEGEKVITEGQTFLDNNSKVKIIN